MSRKSKSKLIQSDEPFAVCNVSIAALRAKPFQNEEMVSQLLFGEMAHILDRKGKHWYKVQCEWDKYVGWVDAKQIHRISKKDFEANIEKQSYALELVQGAMGTTASVPICIGSTLPRFDGMTCKMPSEKMSYSGLAINAQSLEMDSYRLVKLGLKYMHAPYLWGGRSPFGIDGSGLIQMIYKLAGIRIPRDARDQISMGEIIDFPSDAQAADLAFFENSKGNITHVGMITDESRILHAHGKVRVDYFDHHGIYNEDLGKYTHRLRIIKRLIIQEQKTEESVRFTMSNQ